MFSFVVEQLAIRRVAARRVNCIFIADKDESKVKYFFRYWCLFRTHLLIVISLNLGFVERIEYEVYFNKKNSLCGALQSLRTYC